MTVTFTHFLEDLIHNPVMMVTTALMLGVIMVNGWTDAPNAIATCVSTRAMSPKGSVVLAAVFNFFGVFFMTLVNSTVAQTIYNMVDFGGDTRAALTALCAALFAIVVWATAAWRFGIPTSESHALIAGISGAAIALQGGFGGVNGREWIKVVYGLGLSTFIGFGSGWGLTKLIEFAFRRVSRRKANRFFKYGQIVGASAMSFMHGAQDGQKFMGVFLLGVFLAKGQGQVTVFEIPVWLMILCSLVMALGTSIGGYRIIKAVGMDMVKLDRHQGFAADIAASGCLLIASLMSLPVSTTHTKTTCIMGVGASRRIRSVNWGVVKEMVLTWVLTFPGCGLIGYIMSVIFLRTM